MGYEDTLEEIRQELHQKSKTFKTAFGTPDGKKVLEILSNEFDDLGLMDENPHRTHYNLGRRDVVKYIQQMIEFRRENDE